MVHRTVSGLDSDASRRDADWKRPRRSRSLLSTASLRLSVLSVLLCVLALAGCTAGPDYKRPAVDTPQTFWGDASGRTNSLGDVPWWELFRDDTLQTLIRTALTNNYDVRIAATRVEQARAVLAENRAGYFPQVTYTGVAGVGRNAENGSPFPGIPQSEFFEAVGNVSWEVDLWGRIRRMNESARAQFFATEEARTNVVLTLIATVAQDYFQLQALDQELQIAYDTTNSFGQSLKLFSERLRGGVASKLETAAAEAAEASAAATVPELTRQIMIEENQIRILLGMNPGPVLRGKRSLQELLPPDVPPGLPSALLERRPDIRQAEQVVRAANAQIGVAQADFYPRFDLTALFGQVSPQLGTITTGGANAWGALGTLAGPLFEGGYLKAQLRHSRTAWQEAVLRYQEVALNAFQEVANALASREQLARERVEQDRAVRAYQVAVQVATQRYRGGQASYYELLQEQQLLFPAENTLTQTQLNQLLTTVQLYLALGGGWNVAPR
ncbi:MAG: efflux transporter outer membrane subunit [Limisphaerales bacterium]